VPYVYAFDHKHRKPPMEMKDLLGGKGANLAEMTSVLGLPVPPGFTISTDACRAYMHGGWPDTRRRGDREARLQAREEDGPQARGPDDPLLVSVRSGAKFSMPGMMDTVLNLGLNDESVKGLAHDQRRALRLRLLPALHRHVRPHRARRRRRAFEARSSTPRRAGAKTDADIPRHARSRLCLRYKAVVEARPASRSRRTRASSCAAPSKRCSAPGTVPGPSPTGCVSDQPRPRHRRERAGHGLRQPRRPSGTGVGFTRNAATGENKPYGDFLVNAQGEDVVAGIRNTEDLDASASTSRPSTPSCSTSSTGSRRTTATCATPSSPSSRASSGCCRRASASAPARPRCAWPST
jgi:pyruvate, orthophosphate dikinase